MGLIDMLTKTRVSAVVQTRATELVDEIRGMPIESVRERMLALNAMNSDELREHFAQLDRGRAEAAVARLR